jgi:hypothetical protein
MIDPACDIAVFLRDSQIDENYQKESRPAMRLQCGNSAVDSSVNRKRRVQEGGVREGRYRVLILYALATAEAKPSEVGGTGRADAA